MPKKTIGLGALFFVFLLSVIIGGIRTYAGIKSSSKMPMSNNSTSETLPESKNNKLEKTDVSESPAVPVLYYHSIMREAGNEVRMPPDQFEAQMAFLHDQGFQSVTLNQLYQAKYLKGPLPNKAFVITFDDGYVDNYTTAFPILKKYGFVAAVFMVSSYTNGEGFMSWSQLQELIANGWEIESHSANHPYLSTMNAAALLSEVKSPKKLLEKELGRTVNFFAYPYGDYDDDVVLAVKNAGYLMAFTTERGWADQQTDAWHTHRVYCFANMGMNEFMRRIQNPNY